MGRQPAREQRLTAQRASAEFREQVTSNAELLRRIGELEEELRQTKNYRNNALNTVTQLKEELDKIKPPSLDGRRTSIPKLKDHTAKTFYEHVDLIYRNLRRYDSSDIAALTSAAVNKLSRERKEDFAQGLLRAPGLKSARDTLLHDHELKIADHLKLEVLTSDHFSLLRLVGGMSKRLCGLIEQAIKWVHHADGTKTRQVLSPGSTVGMPPIFGLRGINAAEATAESESGVALNDHIDRCGADICGKAHAIDRAMRDSIRWTSRSGGMATKGSLADPHLMCITGDGAGLTAAKSGVRVGHFPGSTNLLNQSSLDCANWLFYKENSKAEDYTVIAGRLENCLPDIRRIYRTGELANDDGTPSGIFVRLVLVADKPFIRHACGMLSHNADSFGAPFCTCCDTSDDGDTTSGGGLYDYTMDTRTHYGNTTVEDLCRRAHVAPWEMMGEREPQQWFFECPCCGEVCACPTLPTPTHVFRQTQP
jgi:hypothetical protein